MALPQGGPWPPSPHGIALQQMALWSAWWIGDPEGLSSVYGAVGGGATSDFFADRQGGIIPTLAKFFWGRPSVTGPVSYTHLRAHETKANIVCRLLLETKKK